LTPGIPQNSTWENYATVIVEIGVSQKWGKRGGLDEKAKKWFNALRLHGLQYILCVKVDLKRHESPEYSYKLYDVPGLNGEFPEPPPNPTSFTNDSAAKVYLDPRRILGIPSSSSLPQGVADPIVIDLSHI
jgi:hypothetical protein